MHLRIRQRVGRVLAEGVTRRLGQTNGGLRLRLNPPYELAPGLSIKQNGLARQQS